MYTGRLVFSQVTDHLPMHTFRRCVQRYQGERYIKRFRCLDQNLIMAFAQLTYRESLRDIEACLRAHQNKLYHIGVRSRVVHSTLFEKVPLEQMLANCDYKTERHDVSNQLSLFENLTGQ